MRDQVALLTRDAAVPAATAPTPPPRRTPHRVGVPPLESRWRISMSRHRGRAQLRMRPRNGVQLRAYLAARVNICFDDVKAVLDEREKNAGAVRLLDQGLDLDPETVVEFDDRDFVAAVRTGGYEVPTVPIDESSSSR